MKPIVKLFSLPFIILTLGLFTLVVNALMLQMTSWLAGALNLDFHVDYVLLGRHPRRPGHHRSSACCSTSCIPDDDGR